MSYLDDWGRSATGGILTFTAKRTEKRRLRRGTGLETVVDLVAIAFLILGAIVAIGLLLTLTLWGLIASFSTIIGAVLNWLLLRCLAEHIRLQKKIAGLGFEGAISGPNEETIWSCSNCGQMLHSENRCDSCGAQIESNVT
jgi:hypothetical protein